MKQLPTDQAWVEARDAAFRRLRRMRAAAEEAEDVAGEAVLLAWRRTAEGERIRNLSAWVAGAARRLFSARCRAAWSTKRVDAELDLFAASTESRDPGFEEEVRKSVAALAQLPSHLALTIRAVLLMEVSAEEVGRSQRVSGETIRNRLRRAITLMREDMTLQTHASHPRTPSEV